MSGYEDSDHESSNEYHEVHKQCDSLLQNINFKYQTNREWVAKCYRKINQYLNDNFSVKFNLTEQSEKLPDLATKYAYQIKPYQFNEGLEHFSKQMEESYAAKKKCETPLIYKSEKSQFVLLEIENDSVLIRENNKFTLKIEAQEKSTIVITDENNHPLLTKPQKRAYHHEKANIEIIPPCIVCLCVIKEQTYTLDTAQNTQRTRTIPFRLPSNVVKIEVVTMTGGKKGRHNEGIGWLDNVMVRPEETFEIVYSNSQNSQAHQYVGIQTESRSRD